MYKILIKYTQSQALQNLWQVYGTSVQTVTSTTASLPPEDIQSTFTEFETDDVSELEKKVEELDAIYGHDNIRVIQDVTYTVAVNIVSATD